MVLRGLAFLAQVSMQTTDDKWCSLATVQSCDAEMYGISSAVNSACHYVGMLPHQPEHVLQASDQDTADLGVATLCIFLSFWQMARALFSLSECMLIWCAARVRVQGPPAQGRSNGQQGMMGRAGGRGNPGRGRGGPEMMNGNAVNMPGPGFFPEMGMPMNGMGPMGPMGPGPMMGMGMDPMNFGRMGGFEGDFGMPNIASMGMGLGHMATPMMMGMGMGDMGAAFPMAMPPPRPPPPCEGLNRPVPTSRPFNNDRTYDDDRVDEFRDPPARSGYSRYCKASWQHTDSRVLDTILPGSPVSYAIS